MAETDYNIIEKPESNLVNIVTNGQVRSNNKGTLVLCSMVNHNLYHLVILRDESATHDELETYNNQPMEAENIISNFPYAINAKITVEVDS